MSKPWQPGHVKAKTKKILCCDILAALAVQLDDKLTHGHDMADVGHGPFNNIDNSPGQATRHAAAMDQIDHAIKSLQRANLYIDEVYEKFLEEPGAELQPPPATPA